MDDSEHSGKYVQDAFLSVYLVVLIILTVAENLILLGAVYATSERRLDLGLCQICAYGLCAGVLLLPFTLAAAADRDLISSTERGGGLCQFTGVLSSFLHRVSTFSLCCGYVDRCLIIAKPMSYSSSHQSIFRFTTAVFNILLALTLSTAPFFLADEASVAFKPLLNAPLCMFRPHGGKWTSFLYADALLSYGFAWTLVLASSSGMLYIACASVAGQRKTAPMNLGTFSEHPTLREQKKQIPTAWDIEREPAEIKMRALESGAKHFQPRCSTLSEVVKQRLDHDFDVKSEDPVTAPSAFQAERNRKRKSTDISFAHASYGKNAKEPPRKKSLVATFYDEVTIHCDGSADWKTCTKVAKASDSEKLAVQRQFNCKNVKNNRLITVSSSMYHDQGRGGSYPHRRKTFRKKAVRGRRQPSRLNTKALFTLTSTLFIFTLTTLPVFMLHLSLATGTEETSEANLALEFVFCVASLSVYAAYPFMVVIADKEMKNNLGQLLKRVFETNQLAGVSESYSIPL